MTFKHVKFEDSPTMRALEKVAKEKGLVKPESLQKQASIPKKADYTPSADFMENIFKLCAGLRTQGLEKEASEIEVNYLNYKRAQTLYETSKETGEDLVQSAHPKGSHKLEGVDSEEATVEDILEQHMKMIQVVEKKPHGKLASSKEVIDSVRQVLGGSFLGNGRANNTRKIAQQAPPAKPAKESGIGTEVAEGAGLMGGVALLKYVFSKLKGANALDAKTIKDVEQQMARGLSKAEADAVRKQVLDRATKEGVERAFGAGAKEAVKDVGIAGAKEITKDVAGAGAKSIATNVVENAATKSPGMWSRVVGFFGRTATLPGGGAAAGETAAVGAGETAAVGAGEVAGAGAVGAAGTVAAVAAAGIVAATVTYLATSAIYENKFYTTQIKDAGNNLLSELKDVDKIAEWQQHAAKEVVFKQNFAVALASAETAQGLLSNPTPAGLNALKKYADALQDASTAAYNLSAAARQVYSGDHMKPGESKEDSWSDEWIKGTVGTSPIARLVGADAPQLADVTITGANFVNAAQKALVEVRIAINQVMDIANKEAAKHVQSVGGPGVSDLKKGYTDTLAEIGKYKQVIQAKRMPNADALTGWLSKIETIVNSESGKFNGVPDANKPDVSKFYSDRLNGKIKPKIKAFADKWMT